MLESWHVVQRGCARLLLAVGVVAYSSWASALGLGEITVHSALNQPFRADIALEDAAGLEEGDLSVSLATADEFNRAGVERVFFLNDLKFTPILRGNRSLVRVSSSKAVNEPFLDFVVQLNQPNGRVLREYTVLIDPPGAPGIVPVADEPAAASTNSPFPSVTPATPARPAAKRPAPTETPTPTPAAPVIDPAAEQLAASVLQNQQLQQNVDELSAKLQGQEQQIAEQKKQITELQTRLAEVKPAPTPAAVPEAVAPAPVAVQESEGINWLLMAGLLVLLGLLLLVWFVRRQRESAQALPDEAPVSPSLEGEVAEADYEPLQQPGLFKPVPDHHDEAPTGDVLEGVSLYLTYGRFSEAAGLLRDALAKEPQRTDLALQLLDVLGKQGDESAYDAQEAGLRETGVDAQQLEDMRARFPKLSRSAAPLAAAAVPIATPADAQPASDDFQLNLDELSMDSSWDLVSPFESDAPQEKPPTSELGSNLQVLPFDLPQEPSLDEPEPELEWIADPDVQTLDDDFLDGFSDEGSSLELEPLELDPLELDPAAASNAEKLEQAQTCIDDGDLDSAVELLNELLREADEPLRQTARTLLAGIR
ncbi:FimV/HubP family polar landmark protein [Pseudomonas fluorescens]|uniref:FimV/HubP family polar landmark protein n=1 Tax=Pseudomonas fluorescens TaxID=294 RepID=UPI00352511B1